MGDRARSVWTQATASRGGDQEHVNPAVLRGRLLEPHLQVSDRLTVMHHYVRVKLGRASRRTICLRVNVPVPIPSYLGVRVPRDEEVNVVRRCPTGWS